ncbi:MAG: peptidyl-tRNA hydrolase [Candidatus Heimdallarchaeota archaeon]|nr:MAG: peptidyl-tRNA hydrolase [Candidatus Heimdallarchaeota archaeon]
MKQIIILRKDLKMSCGKAAAQASHASVAAAIKSQREKLQEFTAWWKTGQKKVVLAVNSEAELHDLETKLRATGVVLVKIDDAGRTQLPPNTSTALGIGPHARVDVEKITSQLKLY